MSKKTEQREGSVYNMQHVTFPLLIGSLLAFCLFYCHDRKVGFVALSKHNLAVEWPGCQNKYLLSLIQWGKQNKALIKVSDAT